MTALLDVRGASKSFGGLKAVHHCSLQVHEGSITGLIGPNGAGKTTLFNVISGIYAPEEGSIWFQGQEITGLRPHVICRRGLARTFQLARGLNQMSVLENMMLAPKEQLGERLVHAVLQGRRVWDQERTNYDRALELTQILGLYEWRNAPASSLSGGQRKMLEVGRALMTNPRLLLLDEPAAGASTEEVHKLLDYLADVRQRGITLFIVEHKMDVIMTLCDTIIVMNYGSVLTSGPPEAIQKDQRVIEIYLGTEAATT